jgi:hypothetical protein
MLMGEKWIAEKMEAQVSANSQFLICFAPVLLAEVVHRLSNVHRTKVAASPADAQVYDGYVKPAPLDRRTDFLTNLGLMWARGI